MKADHTRRLIGGAGTLFGLLWVWFSVYPFIQPLFTSDRETSDFIFLFTIVPLMTIPGALAIVFGIQLFNAVSESSLKWVIGMFAIFGALWISSHLSAGFPDFLPDRMQETAFLFVSSLVALPAYLFIVRLLHHHFTEEARPCTSFLNRGVVVLMALQLWHLLTSIFDEYSPIEEGYTTIHDEPWETLGFLVPIIVAYASYRIFTWLLLLKTQEDETRQSATVGESD